MNRPSSRLSRAAEALRTRAVFSVYLFRTTAPVAVATFRKLRCSTSQVRMHAASTTAATMAMASQSPVADWPKR